MSWFNANSNKRVDVSHKVQSLSCGLNKLIGVENEIVRWSRNHQCVRVFLVKLECDVCYTWRGILLRRFGNDVFSRKVRKLFLHYINILKRSDDEDVFRRHHLAVTIEGLLNECLSAIEYVEKLLGQVRAAHWPKAAPDSSRHDRYVMMFVHDNFFCRC